NCRCRFTCTPLKLARLSVILELSPWSALLIWLARPIWGPERGLNLLPNSERGILCRGLRSSLTPAISSQLLPRRSAVLLLLDRNISIRNIPETIATLVSQASRQCENPSLLRIYWYDAIQGPRVSLEQTTLAHHVGLKLRL